MTTEISGPTQVPPQPSAAAGDSASGQSAPTLLQADAAAAAADDTTSGPTLMPPSALEAAGDQGVTATWRSNVQITALWTIEETRNAFVHVAGVGWRRIYNGRDGSFQALLTLASQARQTNRAVNLREEADGMVYEIYLW